MNLVSIFKPGKERFPALTGIRALAAMAVFFVHLPFSIGFNFTINVIALFFVLSGFLIVYLYYGSTAFSTHHLVNYFTNRFARLYPVYYLLVSIAIWHNHDFHLSLLIKNYTLTHALFHNTKDILIQPSWSLTVEECFYALAPVIMFLIRKYNYFVSFLFGVFLLLAALLISIAPISFLHTPEFVMTTTFFGYFFEFYTGVWLAILILKREKNGKEKRKGSAFTIAGITGTLICLAAQALLYNLKGPINISAFVLLNNFVFAIPITALYFGLICEDTLLSRFLSGKFLCVLGRTTYTFYVVHMLVINYLAIPFVLQYFSGHYNLFVITTFFITELIAILLFILYEEPLNIFIRKKVKALIPVAKQRN
jgi:peptidoglycan/LPS O-acetylase OafA/YrhL